jgi:pimeloyl-ACP methyl ester carboxylesterase
MRLKAHVPCSKHIKLDTSLTERGRGRTIDTKSPFHVSSGIVPHSGHWIMEENPQATVKIVTEFLAN